MSAAGARRLPMMTADNRVPLWRPTAETLESASDRCAPDVALPIHGAAGMLMGAAVANEGIPLSISELGRRAGISKFAACRAAQKLREAGFLRNGPDGWTFNGEHQLADLAREVMWTLLGASQAQKSEEVRARDDDYWTDVPPSLRAAPPSSRGLSEQPEVAAPAPGPLDLPAPTALEVRLLVTTLAQPLNRIVNLEERSQDAGDWWGRERARDRIHGIGALGDASARAFNELSTVAATHRLVDGEWLPPDRPVRPESWLRAAFWVDAELRHVNNVLLRLEESVKLGRELARAQNEVFLLAKQVIAEQGTRETTLAPTDLRQALTDAGRLWDRALDRCRARVGGKPGPDDFGRLGDQLVAAEVRDVAEGLLKVSESLVAHECVQAWMARSPEAAKHPFLTEICRGPKG